MKPPSSNLQQWVVLFCLIVITLSIAVEMFVRIEQS